MMPNITVLMIGIPIIYSQQLWCAVPGLPALLFCCWDPWDPVTMIESCGPCKPHRASWMAHGHMGHTYEDIGTR